MSADQPSQPGGVRRRTILRGAVAGAALLPVAAAADPAAAATPSSRVVYNLNLDWKFVQQDVSGAEAVSFVDTGWRTVSVPHTFDDVDAFDEWITSSGESHVARQIVWYRKHFTLPAGPAGRQVLLEFEGIRQAATVYVNGTLAGRYEYGVTPFGFDITALVRFGAENVIAVQADNSAGYVEAATGVGFEWDSRDFNPTYGGLTRDVRLYVLPPTYFTLPLYTNLRTIGSYVYATNISTSGRSATVTIEAQVRNAQPNARTLTVAANIVDARGVLVRTLTAAPVSVAAGATTVVPVSGPVTGLTFWEPANPSLYTVELVLSDGGAVQDVHPIRTGFRKAEFKGGATTGGVYINDRQLFLTGYAQRSTNEWPLIGGAVPDWLRDYDGRLIRDSNANLIRWMHISATPADIRMTDRFGIACVQPAGDKESDKTDRQWDQRIEVMRDSMIYFRNSPSILFWEAGNNFVTPDHMAQMRALKKTWDPHGMRAIGCRAISDDPAYGGAAAVDQAEYVGTMLNRHYCDYARDRMPLIESEFTRDEAPRRVWDNYSPPDFGYLYGPDATYHWTSEDFAATVAASTRYEFWSQRIQGPGNKRYSGAAALCWSDSNQHGRQYGTETSRESGRVDAVRIPKESYFTHRVMQSARPDSHIVGHWNYPSGTKKTIYVMAANVKKVELLVNGTSVGTSTAPTYDFLHTFPNVTWRAGTVTAVGYDAAGAVVTRAEKQTADAATALRTTAVTAPAGLRADGSDVFLVEFEVVDAQGRRVPTDQARVDVAVTGPGILLGGYNPGKQYSVFKSYVDTEAGVNRVFVRATRTPGAITVTVTRPGLTAGTVQVTSAPVTLTDGLTTTPPAGGLDG